METWNNYTISSYKFTVWFFRLLLLFLVTVVVLLMVLKINETVPIREGQVVADEPQVDYLAPDEAEVAKIYVREGQSVTIGDTLVVLQNQDLVQQVARIKSEMQYLQDRLTSGKKDLAMYRSDYEKQLVQLQEVQKKTAHDLRKLTMVATVKGVVNFIFNSEKATNIIDKGEMLVSIAPRTEKYYAKVAIDEKDLPFVHAGLPVRLKMDAYQSLRYGMITGTVSYISERKQDNRFFAIVDLSRKNKLTLRSGYTVSGEVVLAQLPLYKYFMKKMFQNL
ncbi:MAG: HlyD family efflux transporter periplasmic adaptor subunit [Bacteroidota bacterium]|nr:HlyD family efflux transporter periplasmic adaptor subunit [Bacteroidota bacterium]